MMDDAEERRSGAAFLAAGDQLNAPAFSDVVGKYKPRNIVATKESWRKNKAVFDSLSLDYYKFASTSSYVFYSKRVGNTR
jgi:hypothetical protein